MIDFSKGPWFVGDAKDARSIRYWIVQDIDTWDETVAAVPDHPDKNSIANAHLIAAAPELYEALANLINRMDGMDKMVHGDAIDAGFAALAKANGPTQ